MRIPHWYFWDYLTQYEGDKHQTYFDAYKFIHAVKGDGFNGFLRVKYTNGKTADLYEKDSEHIANLALDHVGQNCLPSIITQNVDLMPIPNSDMIPTSGSDHKIITAATRLSSAFQSSSSPHNINLNTGLRWTSAKTPSHQRPGYRSMLNYEGKLTLITAPEQPVVLFDDVYTSGSQAKAACKFLTDSGHTVLGVVTLAKTTHTPRPKAFEWREDICEYDDNPFDWGDL